MVSEVRDRSSLQTSFHGVRKCEIQYRHHFMVSEVVDNLDLLIHTKGIDARISTWISLCHSGFKGPGVSRNSDLQ